MLSENLRRIKSCFRCDAPVNAERLQDSTTTWYSVPMTTKDRVLQAIRDLPENASVEDAMERLLFLSKIERGIRQADADQAVPHAVVRERMARWLT